VVGISRTAEMQLLQPQTSSNAVICSRQLLPATDANHLPSPTSNRIQSNSVCDAVEYEHSVRCASQRSLGVLSEQRKRPSSVAWPMASGWSG
jgi:hypothetical protein